MTRTALGPSAPPLRIQKSTNNLYFTFEKQAFRSSQRGSTGRVQFHFQLAARRLSIIFTKHKAHTKVVSSLETANSAPKIYSPRLMLKGPYCVPARRAVSPWAGHQAWEEPRCPSRCYDRPWENRQFLRQYRGHVRSPDIRTKHRQSPGGQPPGPCLPSCHWKT